VLPPPPTKSARLDEPTGPEPKKPRVVRSYSDL
jgi:hypothetical protein